MNDHSLIDALQQALAKDPGNGPLWLHYGGLLAGAERAADAAVALRKAADLGQPAGAVLRLLMPALRATGQLAEALVRAEQHLAGADDPVIRLELARVLLARGARAEAVTHYRAARAADPALQDPTLDAAAADAATVPTPNAPAAAEVAAAPASDADWAAQFDWGDLRVTFADVAGLEPVKEQIRLRILAPFQNPEVYRAFGRKAGGGILLYGPPGCGKTFVARATAGECGARFVSVGIHDVIDKYWGESEKLVHALFEDARRHAPTVLFFDEFDALGTHRGRGESQFWKTLVNQFLQEMDGVKARNEGVLVFAATNVPWNVDTAFRRPGRFDRVLFVPPPDEPARAEMLRRCLAALPGGPQLEVQGVMRATELFTGADLKALCERAAERALSQSLATGKVHAVTLADLERERKQMQSSALEWLTTARNYARYANEGGAYDDLVAFLKQHKRW
jgi:SpoVK/Ycf46/Vps4 family AAA+-type ATPase